MQTYSSKNRNDYKKCNLQPRLPYRCTSPQINSSYVFSNDSVFFLGLDREMVTSFFLISNTSADKMQTASYGLRGHALDRN